MINITHYYTLDSCSLYLCVYVYVIVLLILYIYTYNIRSNNSCVVHVSVINDKITITIIYALLHLI